MKNVLWSRYFTLRTDHSALTTLLSPKFSGRAGARVARWQARLMPYSYVVQYVPGDRLPGADTLSRLPVAGDADDTEEEDYEVIALVDDEGVVSEEDIRAAAELDT